MTAALREPGLRTLRERKRVVDGFILATPITLLLASGVPWFFLGANLDLPSLARASFAYAAAYLIIVIAVDGLSNRKIVATALYVAPFVGIAIAGVLWHLAGGISNPALLIVFVLPVLAAAVSERAWAPWTAALFATLTVGTIAILESPSLAWYFTQWGAPLGPLQVFSLAGGVELSGIPPSQILTMIVAFAFAMIVVAAFAHAAIRKLTGESVRLALASSEPAGLWKSALEADPIPLAVVTATGRIVAASERFIEAMLVRREAIPGIELSDVLQFTDKVQIERLLEAGGRAEMIAYRVGPESRLASVEVRPFHHHEEPYRAVSIVDWREVGHLIAAADALVHPLLVIGTEDGRLRWANRPARAILGNSWMGRDLRTFAAAASAGSVEVEGRTYPTRMVPLTGSTAIPDALTVVMLDEPGARA